MTNDIALKKHLITTHKLNIVQSATAQIFWVRIGKSGEELSIHSSQADQTLLKKSLYFSQAWETYFKTPFKSYFIWKSSLTKPAELAAAHLSLGWVL